MDNVSIVMATYNGEKYLKELFYHQPIRILSCILLMTDHRTIPCRYWNIINKNIPISCI
jgi:hypothetical protein